MIPTPDESRAGAHLGDLIRLTLPYPLSANRYWRPVVIKGHAMIVPTKEAKEFKAHIARLCREVGIEKPIAGRVAIAYTLFPERPQDWAKRMAKDPMGWDDNVRCIDLDNAQKVMLDALKGIVIEDDRWVRRIEAQRAEPDGPARLEVEIRRVVATSPQPALI